MKKHVSLVAVVFLTVAPAAHAASRTVRGDHPYRTLRSSTAVESHRSGTGWYVGCRRRNQWGHAIYRVVLPSRATHVRWTWTGDTEWSSLMYRRKSRHGDVATFKIGTYGPSYIAIGLVTVHWR